jgi:hypothetical protein
MTVARIELTGPRTVAPGQAATFNAMAFFTNGSSRDVTSEAQWRTQSAAIFQMDGPGRGTAGQRGDVAISVAFNCCSVFQAPPASESPARASSRPSRRYT